MEIIKNKIFSEKQISGKINDKKYVDCSFSDLVFDDAVITNCQFENCNVSDCVGNKSKIQNNSFLNTTIKDVGMIKAKIEKNNFQSTNILSTAVLTGKIGNNNFKKCEFEYDNFSWTNFKKNIYEDSHAAGIADKASNFEEEFPAENLEACGGWPIQCKSCNLAAYSAMLRHFDKEYPELDAQLAKPKKVETEIVKDKDFSKRLLAKDLSNKTFVNCKFVLSNTIKSNI